MTPPNTTPLNEELRKKPEVNEVARIVNSNIFSTPIEGKDWMLVSKNIEQELTKLIQTLEKKARDEENSRCVEIMKDLFAENFHYRLMCGEIKDPSGKIDVHKAFVEYQELEPERMKFAQYIEERMVEPSAGATAESPNNTTTRSGE